MLQFKKKSPDAKFTLDITELKNANKMLTALLNNSYESFADAPTTLRAVAEAVGQSISIYNYLYATENDPNSVKFYHITYTAADLDKEVDKALALGGPILGDKNFFDFKQDWCFENPTIDKKTKENYPPLRELLKKVIIGIQEIKSSQGSSPGSTSIASAKITIPPITI